MPRRPLPRRCSCSCPSRRRPSSSRSSRCSTTAPRERRHLLAGLGVVAAASALLTAVAWIFAEPLIDLLFGSEYEAADAWLGPLCLAMALYGLAIVYLYHFLALGRDRVAVVLVAAAGGADASPTRSSTTSRPS